MRRVFFATTATTPFPPHRKPPIHSYFAHLQTDLTIRAIQPEKDIIVNSYISIPIDILRQTTHPALERTVDAILAAMDGTLDRPVPSIDAFPHILLRFLQQDLIDGWIYVRGKDERLYPELVTSISIRQQDERRKNSPSYVILHTIALGLSNRESQNAAIGFRHNSHTFFPQDVSRRKPAMILQASGILKETAELKQDYLDSLQRFQQHVQDGFSREYHVQGQTLWQDGQYRHDATPTMSGRRVIHDIPARDYQVVPFHESCLTEGLQGLTDQAQNQDDTLPIPQHPIVRVFDSSQNAFFWVHADAMTPHVCLRPEPAQQAHPAALPQRSAGRAHQ